MIPIKGQVWVICVTGVLIFAASSDSAALKTPDFHSLPLLEGQFWPPLSPQHYQQQQQWAEQQQRQAPHSASKAAPSSPQEDDSFLALFPPDVLQSDAKYRPINVRVVEHDDFIDYEFDFVQDASEGNLANDAVDKSGGGSSSASSAAATPRPELNRTSAAAVTFANLLERARRRHREKQRKQQQHNLGSSTTPLTPQTTPTTSTTTTISTTTTTTISPNDRSETIDRRTFFSGVNRMRRKFFQSRSRSTPVTTPRTVRVPQRFLRLRPTFPSFSSSTVTTTTSTTTTTTAAITTTTTTATTTTTTTTTTTSTTTTTTTVAPIKIFTNIQTASAMMVTRNVTSTNVVTSAVKPVLELTTTPTTVITTDAAASTTLLPPPTTTPLTPLSASLEEEQESVVFGDYDLEDSSTTTEAVFGVSAAQRIPRIIEDDDEIDGEVEEGAVYSGRYHEVNPGQYHEVHPGQYHEVNPGQYHEVNPGQYHEVNPGQYHEVNPGQYDQPLEVEVEVERTGNNQKVYNVQSKVDEFIIGEFGTINEQNGQTLQGVRYTAVADGETGVDPKFIYDTFKKFFGLGKRRRRRRK